MKKKVLQYTWYPKDWQSSDLVYTLLPLDRCTYRELIDLAMEHDNQIPDNRSVWWKKWNYTNQDELSNSIDLLVKAGAVLVKNGLISVPSCEHRLNMVFKNRKNGTLGGRPKKEEEEPKNNPKETQTETQKKPKNNPTETQEERPIQYNTKQTNTEEKKVGVIIPDLVNGIPKLNTQPASKFPEYLYRTRDKICETLNVSELKSMQSYKSITYFCEEIFRQGKIEQLEEVAKYYPMYRQASGMKAHKPQNFTGDANLNYEDGAWCESDWKLKYNEHQTANQLKSTMSFFAIPKPEHQ
jgi:hypothetical protein